MNAMQVLAAMMGAPAHIVADPDLLAKVSDEQMDAFVDAKASEIELDLGSNMTDADFDYDLLPATVEIAGVEYNVASVRFDSKGLKIGIDSQPRT